MKNQILQKKKRKLVSQTDQDQYKNLSKVKIPVSM